jgi:catechol 2,3-dioxygenase-like lactoylglutathione lyase family enzyme
MLGNAEIIAFVAAPDGDRALEFYRDIMGLELVADTPFAIVMRSGATSVRIQKVASLTPAQHTVLGWRVDDIEAVNRALAARGVKFEVFPGMTQDGAGIWTTPDGSRVCWFKDPAGNTLSLTQFLI